ncbi:MAG: NAD(P)-binding domain-containing protein [Mariniphaga sp.]|nr:NAD(P)-binding domain-containing protein [Mariniphaga sp.]
MKKKIGIIGSGTVGQILGTGFLNYGYEVKIGTRDLTKLADWKSTAGVGGSIGSFDEAAQFGDLIVLATKGSAALNALQLAGKANLSDKTIIDTTNPIADTPPENGVLNFFTDLNDSLMERLQNAFPEAHFVKAFNSIGGSLMINPDFGTEKPTMFICGNDQKAKDEVAEICILFGFETADMGTVEAARAIEPLCMLWCIPGFRENKWNHAFRLLKR